MIRIGEILYNMRKKKGIGQEKLCRGLCSKGTYSKYESGERIPDWLLLNVIFQRMGANVEKLAAVLTIEEYQYFCWKKKILVSIEREEFENIDQYLEEPQTWGRVINKNIQEQFVKWLKAIVIEKEGIVGESEQIAYISLLKQAARITMPGIEAYNIEQYLISENEMRILLELIKGFIKIGKEEEAYRFLWGVLKYMEQHYEDYEVKVKIYPKAVRILLPLLQKKHEDMMGMLLCKKTIDLLCWQGVLWDLRELLSAYLMFDQRLSNTELSVQFEKNLWALDWIYEMVSNERYKIHEQSFSYQNQELYLINEVIKWGRMSQAISQEKLSEEICTPETLSRIENGKQAPNARNFRAFMDKSEMDIDYFNGEFETDDFFVLEKKLELDRAVSLNDWKAAEEILKILKEKLDMTKLQNCKMIKIEECCILYNQGKIDSEKFIEVCENILNCQGERWKKKEFWTQFFSRSKIYVMNYMACLYRRNNKMEQAIFILENILEKLMNSKTKLSDRYKSSVLILMNLSSWYGENGQYEKCIEMCNLGIKICLESGRGIKIATFLVNKAEAIDRLKGFSTKTSQTCFRCAYYIGKLMSDLELSSYIERYYQMHYDSHLV